jgi:hypothetical protein
MLGQPLFALGFINIHPFPSFSHCQYVSIKVVLGPSKVNAIHHWSAQHVAKTILCGQKKTFEEKLVSHGHQSPPIKPLLCI